MKFFKNSKIEENSYMDLKKTAYPLGGLYNKFSPKKWNKPKSDEDIDINQEEVNSLLSLDVELDAKEIKELYLPIAELISISSSLLSLFHSFGENLLYKPPRG